MKDGFLLFVVCVLVIGATIPYYKYVLEPNKNRWRRQEYIFLFFVQIYLWFLVFHLLVSRYQHGVRAALRKQKKKQILKSQP